MRTRKGAARPLSPLRNEIGWTGAFTRANAAGAMVSGTPVVKCNTEPGDSNQDGTRGVVLGSISHPEVRDGEVMYFVEWLLYPRIAVAVSAHKVRACQ